MKHTFKRVLSILCALLMLISCFTWTVLAADATVDEGDTPSGTVTICGVQANKWTIVTNKALTASSDTRLGFTQSGLNIDLPDSMTLENMALYFHVTLDAASAAVMNGTGDAQVELRNAGGSDDAELNIACYSGDWSEGENYVVIPIGAQGTRNVFDLHQTIVYFRMYSSKATQDVSATFHEIAIVDVTGIDLRKAGSEFGANDTYLQTTSPLTTSPATIEASVKLEKREAGKAAWTIGLPKPRSTYNGLTNGGVFTVSAADAVTYGIADGTEWRSFKLAKGAGFGTEAMTFTALPIPTTYTKADLALTFWMYWKPATTGTPFNLQSYIELSNEGGDKNEVYWRTDTYSAFKNLKEGWNKIVLPLSEGTLENNGGDIDVNNIGYFRIWGQGGNDAILATENYEIGMTAPAVEVLEKGEQVLTSWTLGLPGTSAGTYVTAGAMGNSTTGTTTTTDETTYGVPANTAYIEYPILSGGYWGAGGKTFTTLDIPATYTKADLALTFWMYFKPETTGTAFNLTTNIELTSSGKADVNEIYWNTSTHSSFKNLKEGWNLIVLPLSDGVTDKGVSDIVVTGINYVRMHAASKNVTATENYTIRMTPFTVVALPKVENTYAYWKLGNVGNAIAKKAGSDSDGYIYEMTAKTGTTTLTDAVTYGVPYGMTWKGGTVLAGGNFGLQDAWFDCIIPTGYTMDDLDLVFWLYTDKGNLADATELHFELRNYISGDASDDYELCWDLNHPGFSNLQVGWNKIVLPLSEPSHTSEDEGRNAFTIDYASTGRKIKFTRTHSKGHAAEDTEIYVSQLYIVAHDDPTVTVDASTIDTSNVYTILSNQGTTEQNPLSLFITKDGNPGFIWGSEGYVAKDFNAMTGEWIDLALVFDQANARFLMYADAQMIASVATDATALGAATVAHSVGANAIGGAQFKGMLADIRLWSDVRTQEELDANRIKDKDAYGSVDNGLNAETEGLMGAWTLDGGIDYVLGTMDDLSANGNDLIYLGSRVEDWEDYTVPTDVIGEDYYTMVFIPDTQNLVTGKYTEEWMAAAQWIADNIENENIIHVIGAGDSTWNDTIPEYEIARAGWDLFADKVSWSNMIGNHDYPWWDVAADGTRTRKPDRDTTNYATYFGMDYINSTKGAENFVEYFTDPFGISTTENAYYRFSVNGTPWMILQIEYHPRAHVIQWADSILKKYPGDNVILTTHGYIGGDNADYSRHWMTYTQEDVNNGGYIGSLMDPPVEWNSAGGATDSSSEEPVWTHLIYPNNNVKMLLCGHSATSDGHILTRWDENVAGNLVPQLMINAQDVDVDYFEDHAMSMLGLLRFSADGSRVEIQYYSPYHQMSYHPSNQDMRSLTLTLNDEHAQTGSDGLAYELNTDKNGYVVTGYVGNEPDVVVPAMYNGLPVTEFAVSEFTVEVGVERGEDGSIILGDEMFNGEATALDSLTFLSKTIIISSVISTETRICGYVASTAQAYATANGNTFVVLPEIAGAGISLGRDIAINYTVYLNEDQVADTVLRLTMNGATVDVQGVAVAGSPNKYRFSLTGKGPHMMTDCVAAQLICNGEVLDQYDNYSIRQYCLNMLGRIEGKTITGYSDAQYAALKTLIVDLLEYGAMAQLYKNYKTEMLANDGIDIVPTEFVAMGDEYKMPTLVASTSNRCTFYSAAVVLKDVLTIRIRFATSESNLDNIKVVMNGQTYTKESFTALGACTEESLSGMTIYEISTGAIHATKFNAVCQATLYENDVACQSISYSVLNYLYSKQNDTTIEYLAELVKCIRNYGLSAEAFRDSQ